MGKPDTRSPRHLATRKTVLIVNLVLSLFFLMNAVPIWAVLAIYDNCWHFLLLLSAVLGNLLWLLLSLLLKRHSSPFFRLSRAALGPFWVFWNFLIFLYSSFILILGALWLAT